jgi:glycosyltransferase involved in cell wall biosynthesis
MKVPAKRLKVVMFVGGFPLEDNPSRCVFNKRAAESLGEMNDVTVVFARFWRPGKKIVERSSFDTFKLLTVYVPFPFVSRFEGLRIKFFAAFLKLVLRRTLADADVIHSVGANTIGLMASEISKDFKKKHVAQLIGSDVNTILPRIRDRWYVRGWEKHIDGISGNSKAIIKEFNSIYQSENIPAIVNYRGVNTGVFQPANKNPDKLQVFFIGGLPDYPDLPYTDDTKGGRSLMKIWSELSVEEMRVCNLIFAGPGADKKDVSDWRATLPVKESVSIAGKLDPAEVRKYMSESHLVVIPSKEEGTPNSCFEAMASGCAVLGSDVGGIPELIDQDVTGKVLPAHNLQEWVKTLKWAVANKEKVIQMGQNARQKAIKQFDHRLFSERLMSFYNEVLKN